MNCVHALMEVELLCLVELKPYRVSVEDNTAQVFGGLLPNKYHLESFHFHWGRKNNRGSEHVIDSVR